MTRATYPIPETDSAECVAATALIEGMLTVLARDAQASDRSRLEVTIIGEFDAYSGGADMAGLGEPAALTFHDLGDVDAVLQRERRLLALIASGRAELVTSHVGAAAAWLLARSPSGDPAGLAALAALIGAPLSEIERLASSDRLPTILAEVNATVAEVFELSGIGQDSPAVLEWHICQRDVWAHTVVDDGVAHAAMGPAPAGLDRATLRCAGPATFLRAICDPEYGKTAMFTGELQILGDPRIAVQSGRVLLPLIDLLNAAVAESRRA